MSSPRSRNCTVSGAPSPGVAWTIRASAPEPADAGQLGGEVGVARLKGAFPHDLEARARRQRVFSAAMESAPKPLFTPKEATLVMPLACHPIRLYLGHGQVLLRGLEDP